MNTEENIITVVVVDDHALIREGVIGMISRRKDIVVVGKGSCGEDMFDLVAQHRPHVLILDLRMPHYRDKARSEKFEILKALSWLKAECPETAVIILSQHANQTFVQAALEHGVRGYLLKDDMLSLDIIEAIDAVLEGVPFFSQDIIAFLYDIQRNNGGKKLTDRQMEIIRELVRNPEKPIVELAADFHIAPSTMKGHFTNLFTLLDAPNRPALMFRVLQLGLVPFHVDNRGRIEFD
jgi:DNA-binding NarL/FixJ family response regulator